MPRRRLFDGPLGEFLRKYKVIRRTAVVAAIIVAIYFLGAQNGWWSSQQREPKSEDHIAAPAEELAELVRPVSDILADSPDGERLSALFLAFADCIEGDKENLVKNTGQVASAHSRSGRLLFGDELKGKHPKLGKAVDAAIFAHIGEGDLPLTGERRQQVVEVFRALAWAAEQH